MASTTGRGGQHAAAALPGGAVRQDITGTSGNSPAETFHHTGASPHRRRRTRSIPAGWLSPGRCAAAIAAVLASLWAFLLVARVPVLSGFRIVSGDRADGLIAISIQRHWANLVLGRTRGWDTTEYFFPMPGTLGYNDGYLLHGLMQGLFGALGADVFLGAELANLSLRGIGFVALLILLRRHLGLALPFAALGAAIFTTSNNFYLHGTNHAQLLGFCLLPLVVLLGLEALAAARARAPRRFVLLAFLLALLFGAMLLTAYYPVFFGLFLLLVLLPVLGVAALVFGVSSPPALARETAMLVPWLLGTGLLLAVTALPFLLLYLPKAAETGMHSLEHVAHFMPRPWDVVNVGAENPVWSRLLGAALRPVTQAPHASFEHATGVTPLLFGLFAMAPLALWAERRTARGVLLLGLWAGTLLAWALMIRWSAHIWPWRFIHDWLPGAAAARVVSRGQLALTLPVVLLAVSVLATAWRTGSAVRPVVLTLVALLLLEQGNGMDLHSLDRRTEQAFLDRVGPPPQGCRVFYAERARPGPSGSPEIDGRYSHNADAMMVAALSGVPTINGLATFTPPGFDVDYPDRPDYLARVQAILDRYGLHEGVCAVDFDAGIWRWHQPRLP